MERRIENIENDIIALKRDLGSVVTQFNQDKKTFTDEIENELAKHKLVLGEVVDGARREFGELRNGLNELYKRTETTVINLQQRVKTLEGDSSSGRGNNNYNNSNRG